MSGPARPQLGRSIVAPFTTIGVLAAVLTWEVEHAGSILLAVAVTAGGAAVGVVVARQLRRDIENVADQELYLSVSDTGIGFSPDVARLFERFRQGDSSSTRQHGGLGLGLDIVRHVVELHGGTVTATSGGENAGSTFEVRLPIRPWDATVLDAPCSRASVPSLRGVSVLVVDDDLKALEFVRTTLEQFGAIVATASSAKEAKGRYRRETPDVFGCPCAGRDRGRKGPASREHSCTATWPGARRLASGGALLARRMTKSQRYARRKMM